MGTDEKPSGLSLPSETETGHGRDDLICIVVGIRTKQCCLKSTQGKFLNPDWLLHMVKGKVGNYVAMLWDRSVFRGKQ